MRTRGNLRPGPDAKTAAAKLEPKCREKTGGGTGSDAHGKTYWKTIDIFGTTLCAISGG